MTRRPYCQQEVADRDGYLDACNNPAVATRTDDNGDEYAVCDDHQGPPSIPLQPGKTGRDLVK